MNIKTLFNKKNTVTIRWIIFVLYDFSMKEIVEFHHVM